jgi:GntR family transcriptional regulator/MocR family aminotransferase
LEVHRKTVVAAYEELYAQDWIETIPRKGVHVAGNLPEIKPRTFKKTFKSDAYGIETGFAFFKSQPVKSQPQNSGTHKLFITDGFPDPRIAPMDEIVKLYRDLFRRPSMQKLIMYGNLAGSENLRKTLVHFLSNTRGVNIGTENIMITHGAQMAIYMTAQMLIKPGSTVMVGEPNYFMANMIFENFGARLQRVNVDENGIDVDAIEKICKRKKPALLYIIPHHHHPTTVTLSANRRMKLLQIIREHKLPVIEDDYDYDYHYSSSPIIPLASADHGGNVIYIGSLTKTLATSVRLGYMIAPENFINEAKNLRRLIDIRGDNILEEAIAILFENGIMQRHLKKSLKLYHHRRDEFCKMLATELTDVVSFTKPAGGMACWAQFNKKYSLPVIARRASAKGMYIADGLFYNTGNVEYNSLRMGFASLNEEEMKTAFRILKQCIF